MNKLSLTILLVALLSVFAAVPEENTVPDEAASPEDVRSINYQSFHTLTQVVSQRELWTRHSYGHHYAGHYSPYYHKYTKEELFRRQGIDPPAEEEDDSGKGGKGGKRMRRR